MSMTDVAFGSEPGRWPLPAAHTPHGLWLRAVAAGGQGRYGAAIADLETSIRRQPSGPLASLAHSTHASFLRQLGWHDRARRWDGRAVALAGGDDEAAADALIGLAADALGVGRFAASARALQRAGDVVTGAELPRASVRLAWVSAELAMVSGRGPAVEHAERAVAAAGGLGSRRHEIKSAVVLAAALCSAGDVAAARRVADAALADTEDHGMVPLRWALACMLVDIGSTTRSAAEMAAIRDQAADTVRSRGGVWAVR
jgi:hypothetical protein